MHKAPEWQTSAALTPASSRVRAAGPATVYYERKKKMR